MRASVTGSTLSGKLSTSTLVWWINSESFTRNSVIMQRVDPLHSRLHCIGLANRKDRGIKYSKANKHPPMGGGVPPRS